MPYISQERRRQLNPAIRTLEGPLEEYCSAGDIAYIVYRLMLFYWRRGPSFAQWATLRGAIADQIDEFRDRHIRDYEAGKRRENGDVQ